MADKIKLLLAAVVLAGAVGAFYYFADQQLIFRVLGLLAGVGVAAAIAAQSAVGRSVLDASRGAWLELRKVVWPSRKETGQTTLMVMVMVVIVGLILWMFDSLLAWAVRMLTGQGG